MNIIHSVYIKILKRFNSPLHTLYQKKKKNFINKIGWNLD